MDIGEGIQERGQKMSKLTYLLTITKKLPVLTTATAVLFFVFLSGISNIDVLAWGPDRPTYTNESPAAFATFNSITDNAAVGDERNFVRIREAGTHNTYEDELEVVPGKEYEVYIYYHNNAASNTNSTGYGIATDVRVASGYPSIVNPGDRGMVSALIYWKYFTPDDDENALDGAVWDEAYVTTQFPDTVLRYKTGTAVIHNGGEMDGSVLSTDLFTQEGTHIGYNELAGVIPGCAEYSGHITYTLVAESTTSELTQDEIQLDSAANVSVRTDDSHSGSLAGFVKIILAILIVLVIAGGGFLLGRISHTKK